MVARWDSGETVSELAEAYDLHRTTVWEILRDAGRSVGKNSSS
jgi:hypothetical protein